jgi:hypothetical protein
LVQATYTDALKTVAAGSTALVINLSATSTMANAGGYIKITSGTLVNTVRTIRSVVGVAVTLSSPLPSVPATGVTLQVVKGCDKTRTTCNAFGNIAKYGGFPDTPKPESTQV